ncbi:hypothetical protein B0H11DRAFT_2191490 [Mycena galericulata]|nr:hypothetical protein B0H11DRAFT_2191490 [Mycena galericulata]
MSSGRFLRPAEEDRACVTRERCGTLHWLPFGESGPTTEQLRFAYANHAIEFKDAETIYNVPLGGDSASSVATADQANQDEPRACKSVSSPVIFATTMFPARSSACSSPRQSSLGCRGQESDSRIFHVGQETASKGKLRLRR